LTVLFECLLRAQFEGLGKKRRWGGGGRGRGGDALFVSDLLYLFVGVCGYGRWGHGGGGRKKGKKRKKVLTFREIKSLYLSGYAFDLVFTLVGTRGNKGQGEEKGGGGGGAAFPFSSLYSIQTSWVSPGESGRKREGKERGKGEGGGRI